MNRRDVLKLGAIATTAVAVGGVTRLGPRKAGAQPSAAPVVDRLVLTTVVDNVYDVFAKHGRLDTIDVQRTRVAAGATLLAEHGLAYHLDSTRGGDRREILLDFSLTDKNLSNNYGVLKIDPARADALILSHGHMDHYGALPDLVRTMQGRLKPGLAVYAGGEDTFCHRVVVTPTATVDQGSLDRAALEAGGLKVVLAKRPDVVAGHALTTGQIERLTDFEKPPAAARLEAGPMGSACSPTHFGATKVEAKPGDLVPDNFQGEHATVYHVRDRGLVVITSCGHAGVINSVRQAQKITGVSRVHAIVGGFHLAPAPDAVVTRTVAAFREIDPDYILPMHCTGFNTIVAVHQAMPKKLVMPSTGTRVVFGA
jgi:7,8-dihydropterin-6-yl-methyl-4-(beta-D-ribofuranosyl)aminobenzene 5'-phosphate synthase